MQIFINDTKIPFSVLNIKATFNSIADTFSFSTTFDTTNPTHRYLFNPTTYAKVTITHFGMLVCTGIITGISIKDTATPDAEVVISGYTATGILEHCMDVSKSTETSDLNFLQIIQQKLQHYNIGLVVDDNILEDVNKPYPLMMCMPSETLASYFDSMLKRMAIVMSHTADGRLLLTRYRANRLLTKYALLPNESNNDIRYYNANNSDNKNDSTKDDLLPIGTQLAKSILYTILDGDTSSYIEMKLDFDGSKMNTDILMLGVISTDTQQVTSGEDLIVNPYAGKYRDEWHTPLVAPKQPIDSNARGKKPGTFTSTISGVNGVPLTARMELGKQLADVKLTISVVGWSLDNYLITTNQLIKIQNSDLMLYKPNLWFIKEVEYFADYKEGDKCTLHCVLPEVFSKEKDIINVFELP